MLTKFLPFLAWFKGYGFNELKADGISGITVALVLIPQSMAYAQLAGLPPYYGLYAAFLPPMVASLFGSSRQLATGPVAVVSLMTAASLGPLAAAGSPGYIAYAVLLALIVGAFQFMLGVLRLGLVVNFLSHPVVNGFTNAAAIIIASSQLSKMFGVDVDSAEHHYETIMRVIESAIIYTHWPTLGMGVLAFAIMYGLRRINRKIPNVLVAVAVTTLISWAIGFEHDAKVDISAIEVPEVKQRVREFNEAVSLIPRLADERVELGMALDAVQEKNDFEGVLDVKHDLSIVDYRTEEAKHRAHECREWLRKNLFVGQQLADGSYKFYLKDAVPAGVEGDGRIWRLKVKNDPLKESELRMVGGGAIVGKIPEGLPTLAVPKFDLKVILRLLPFAVIISILGFMEAISIAKAMAAKTGQRLDPNQELIGQGLGNMLGAIGQSYPTSGSFSRSAVNLQAGAVSGFSAVITSVMVIIVLLFFTPLLYHLPQAVLAAVIMMAVIGLINVSGFIHAWKAQWYDGAISIISFVATLAFAPHLDKGIMIGVVLSLGMFLYKSMRPRVATLSMAEDKAHRDSLAHGLKECDYIAMVRFDGPLFFANASYLEDCVAEIRLAKKKLRHIVLVCSGINDVDASGEEALSLLVDRIRSAGMEISLSGVNESVMKVLKRTHLLAKIREQNIYPTTEQAVCAIHERAHRGGDEKECPLTAVCRIS